MDRSDLLLTDVSSAPTTVPVATAYEPPRIDALGTLVDLTLGGTIGPDDGQGGAGAEGSV